MLYYYMPGLDVSRLTDKEYITRLAHLVAIRKMEGDSSLNNALKKLVQDNG
jgi:hypothetical protein